MEFVRRHRLLVVLGAFALLLVVLVLLALPLRTVPSDANAAKAEVTQAVEALKTSDAEQAFTHVAAARTQVDAVTDVTDGIGARIWSWIPVAGGAVSDVRNLATALDHLTSALEATEEVYPKVSGDDATLMVDGNVSMPVLDEVLAALAKVDSSLGSAKARLDEVEGDAPFVGQQAADARDEALEQVVPVADGLHRMQPLLDRMPSLLGQDGEKKYVIAMMNPSEMRFSGGAMLTYSVMTLDGGEIDRGRTVDGTTSRTLSRSVFWDRVPGNPFVSRYSERIIHANIAPSWPVAGEETLRAWERLRGTEVDGLIALDVVALSRMLQVTGPIYVEGLGQVRADNLVKLTAGDYDRFTVAQQTERKALNRALIPAFTEQLFSGVDFVATMRALGDAADGRHLALYFRDEPTQQAVADFDFDGDLSDTDQDYLGFFTQNLVGSKADFWQHKDIRSSVTLAADGSAEVTLVAAIDNTAPAALTGELSAYTDPTLDLRLGLFLPRGAKVSKVTVVDSDGERRGSAKTGDYFGRPYLDEKALIKQGERSELRVRYTVPQAATRTAEGLRYRLDLDPHATISDARTRVTVTLPEGFTAEAKAGWTKTDKGAWRWSTDALAHREQLTLTARR